MPHHQSRSSIHGNANIRMPPKKIHRKSSTTCLPDHNGPKSQQRRVTVLGSASVGKSAIITQFLYERFPSRYKKTIDELHRAEYEIAGQNLTLEILDTSGYYQFPAMRELAIRKSEAFVLVFSVDNEESLEEMKDIRDEILRIKRESAGEESSSAGSVKVPMVVVANKIDIDPELWKINRPYVECLVKCDWEFCGYVETSAKLNVNVVEIFKELLAQANVQYALSPAIRKRRESLPNVVFRNVGLEGDGPAMSSSPRNTRRRTSVAPALLQVPSSSLSRRSTIVNIGKRDSCLIT